MNEINISSFQVITKLAIQSIVGKKKFHVANDKLIKKTKLEDIFL